MIEQTTKKGWACSDGTFFENKAEAENHELRVELTAIVEGFHYHDMSEEDIVRGLLENIDRIKAALR